MNEIELNGVKEDSHEDCREEVRVLEEKIESLREQLDQYEELIHEIKSLVN